MSRLLIGDCRDSMRKLIAEGVKVQMCVTSPPYWGLRDYGVDGQLGLEPTIPEFVANMVEVFGLVRDLLADDGTLWLNLGDSYASGGRKTRDPGQSKLHPAFTGDDNLTTTNRPDTPEGLKPKDLCGVPWRVAFALQDAGWWLRQDIIWHKPNPMPESIRDRCTKAHEYLFLLAKSERYLCDMEAIREECQSGPSDIKKMIEGKERIGGKHKELVDPLSMASSATNIGRKRSVGGAYSFARNVNEEAPPGQPNQHRADREDIDYSIVRNKRTVWTVATAPYSGAHFATYPPALIEPCILAGSKPGDVVFDPFFGSGTTGEVAQRLGREWIGCELNPEYGRLAERRTSGTLGLQLVNA